MTESPPWSHPVAWSAAGTAKGRLNLQADAEVRARVARFLDLESVGKLEASVSAHVWLDGMELTGRIVAIVTRLCGVSLEAFEEAVDAPLHMHLAPVGSPHAPLEQQNACEVVGFEAVGAHLLAAVRTQHATQSLRQHSNQARGQEKRLYTHVHQTCNGANGSVGVQRRHHQMPGEARLNCDLRGLEIADLPDHDDVGVLPQDCS